MVEDGRAADEGRTLGRGAHEPADAHVDHDVLLDELFIALDVATARLRSLVSLEAGELVGKNRERLTDLLDSLEVESKRVLESFGRRCGFCRTAPAQLIGECAQCGVEACEDCATAFQGVILHRGTCAAFYGGTPTT
jgi:hypothetical protein